MKTLTCKQLGGACDLEFHAENFNEIARLSQEHGQSMFKSGDKAHLEAMKSMTELMQTPEGMKHWMAEKQKEFDALPNT